MDVPALVSCGGPAAEKGHGSAAPPIMRRDRRSLAQGPIPSSVCRLM